MAFNPMHAFRRYQKAIFAVLAVVCMVLFVLSSGAGGGDLLTQLTDWVGGRGSVRGDRVATLDGRTVSGMDLGLLRQQRRLANEYIELASNAVSAQLLDQMSRQPERLDPSVREWIQSFQMERDQLQYNLISPVDYLTRIAGLRNRIAGTLLALEAGGPAAPSDQQRKDQKTQGLNMIALIDHDLKRARRPQNESYFGGNPDSQADNLDFLVWKRQADQLGVRLSPEDVNLAVSMELFRQPLTNEAATYIHRLLRERFGPAYSIDRLQEALGDEIRVRTVRQSFLGQALGNGLALPTATTPDEQFDWYRDVRTTVRAGLIDVPVAGFVDKVTERPTPEQIRALYDEFKNSEYDPRQDKPGFKEPRKVKVEWFQAPFESEFYRKLTDQAAGPLQALAAFGTAMAVNAGGLSEAAGTAAALQTAVADVAVARLYQEYLNDVPKWTDPLAFGRRSGLHDSSVLRAENAAVMVGTAVADAVTGGGPFGAPLAFEGRAVVREIRDRAKIGASAILAGALEPAALAIDALPMLLTPAPQTEAALRPALAARAREELARRLVELDIAGFDAELTRRFKDQDANNAAAFISEFIHARQFQRGGTAEPVDRFSLPNDPGVAVLRPVVTAALKREGRTDPTGEAFAATLADGPVKRFEPSPRPQNFHPQRLDSDTAAHVFWRSDDREPKAVPIEQARPRVEAAWVMQKARELARKEADRLAAEAKALGGDEQKLRDLAVRTTGRPLVEVGPLAVWNPRPAFTGGPPRYDPPLIAADKIPHAGEALAAAVVDLRKQDVGATAVAPDVPRANYFLAVLTNKDVPTVDQFRVAFRNASDPTGLRETLFDRLGDERQRAYERDLMKQLRTTWKLVVLEPAKGEPSEAGG
jgi:hypothetical protein